MPILKEKIKLSNDKIYDFDNISLFSNIMTIVFDKNGRHIFAFRRYVYI